jgi:hypothetical protein
MMRRRDLLGLFAACAGGALLGRQRRALAIGAGARFTFGQLSLPGAGGDGRPTALRRLLLEIDKRTSIDCTTDPVPVRLGDPRLHATPFLWLTGETGFILPPDRELAALRRFLGAGGFMVIDSAAGRVGGDFDAQVRRLCAALFPEASGKLAPLADDHVIYKSFYLLDGAPGRLALVPRLEAVTHDGRACIVYTQNDLAGAFAKDDYGRWTHECYPDGDRQRELAFRLGVNLAMYALCLDYKTDQVHLPFILKRRRWKADDAP